MTRKRRTLLDALADKLVELVDDYDITNLLPSQARRVSAKKLPPVKLKATVVDVTAEDVTKDVKP